jgi:hypothetical protein
MEQYINNFDNLKKIIVFDLSYNDGGIGDCIKFFVFFISICIEKNIRAYYKVNNLFLEKYIKLKYPKMYIFELNDPEKIKSVKEFDKILDNIYYIVKPHIFYTELNNYKNTIPVSDVFYFSDDVIINSHKLLPPNLKNYISIHLRLGDKYLETDLQYILCKDDARDFDEDKLFNLIKSISNENIIFFCDNNEYKNKIKRKFNNIIIINSKIGHTTYTNTTDEQVLDSVTEFYLISNSKIIYAASHSGFSRIAAKFKNIQLINIY